MFSRALTVLFAAFTGILTGQTVSHANLTNEYRDTLINGQNYKLRSHDSWCEFGKITGMKKQGYWYGYYKGIKTHECFYKDDKKDSVETSYNMDGVVYEQFYRKNGVLYKAYFGGGTYGTAYASYFGKKTCYSYFFKGTLIEKAYFSYTKEAYCNGELNRLNEFRGERFLWEAIPNAYMNCDSIIVFNATTGLTSTKQYYKKCMKTGIWEYYDLNGKLIKTETYSKDKLVDKHSYF